LIEAIKNVLHRILDIPFDQGQKILGKFGELVLLGICHVSQILKPARPEEGGGGDDLRGLISFEACASIAWVRSSGFFKNGELSGSCVIEGSQGCPLLAFSTSCFLG
ncbi:hypothetical protein HAX54_033271, partial [Datura stramonium]|nr:hypothetical protein [Datura stramonium]